MLLRRALFLNPDPAGGGGAPPPPPETAKVTLPGGAVVELPKAEAEKFHAAQQKHNLEREELAKKVGAVEAERKAAQDKAEAEARDKEAIRLAGAGELAKARELLTGEANARLAKVTERAKRQEIEVAIRRAAPGLDAQAVDDMVALVTPRAAIDAETGAVTFTDGAGAPIVKDGKPAGADAFLADFLSTRKHFQLAKVPARTGGDPPPDSTIGTIRLADLAKMTPAQAAAMVAGKLRVVE